MGNCLCLYGLVHIINEIINGCVANLSYRFSMDTSPEYILDGVRMTIETYENVLIFFNDNYVDDDIMLHLFIHVHYEETLSVDKVLMPLLREDQASASAQPPQPRSK